MVRSPRKQGLRVSGMVVQTGLSQLEPGSSPPWGPLGKTSSSVGGAHGSRGGLAFPFVPSFLPQNCRASLEDCLVRWFWSPPTGHILRVWKAQPRHIQAIFVLWKPSLISRSPPLDSRQEVGGFPTVKHCVPSSWWSKSWLPSVCFLFLLESRRQPLHQGALLDQISSEAALELFSWQNVEIQASPVAKRQLCESKWKHCHSVFLECHSLLL